MKRSLSLLLVLTLALFAFAACGADDETDEPVDTDESAVEEPEAPADGVVIDAELGEFYITLSDENISAGTVTFNVTNEGGAPHELAVLRTDTPGADLESDGSVAEEPGLVDRTSSLDAGETEQLTVELEPGNYVLICNIPGHHSAGQHLDIEVS